MTEQNNMIKFACTALGLGTSDNAAVSPLNARGSDRVFYRFTWGEGNSAILVHYDPQRTENTYYADIAAFLGSKHIPVPRIIGHDGEKHLILMEDLGEKDLYAFGKQDWTTRRILYQKTLGAIKRLHSIFENDFPFEKVRIMEGFGPDLYRFEHNYFLDHFVKGYCGIGLETGLEARLKEQLSSLGDRLSKCRRCLVHRDLQSQNVMIRDGEPYFIDFQGMRFGNPFYDLGSLLCDPYVTIPPEDREELLSFYYVLSSQELDWETFQGSFWEASAQRLMQALGAYGFLGITKGLKTFLDHIPAGLDNLRIAASHVPALSALYELADSCRITIE